MTTKIAPPTRSAPINTELFGTKDIERKELKITESIDWQPVNFRLKIKPERDVISAVIEVAGTRETYVRGVIVAMGPHVGLDANGKRVHTFHVGQRILYNKLHEVRYTNPDGTVHTFIKEDAINSIMAFEPWPEGKESTTVELPTSDKVVSQFTDDI